MSAYNQPISALGTPEPVKSSNNVMNLVIYFIVIFIIVWILLYFLNPSFIQQVNTSTEKHNGVQDNTKIFIWSVVIAIIIVAIIYFVKK